MDIKKISDNFENLLNEYSRSLEDSEIESNEELTIYRTNFIFAKLSELFTEIQSIKDEIKMCKRII